MPRRKAEAGLEPNRRAELLRAAARLFVEKGFDATTTRDIADAVGMRSGSPFYHFRSKQELLKTAMVEGLDAGYTRLLAAIDGVSEPKQRLRILVRTHLGTLLEGECPAPMLLGETRALDAAAHAEIAAAFDRYQVPWQATLDELAQAGKIPSAASPVRLLLFGMLGALLVEMPDGRRFRIGSGLTQAQRRAPPPLGTWITYRYNGVNQRSGLPRFARFLRERTDLPGVPPA
ncbi:MAG: TetR family transcriptional regulator [Candidatus Accumulibacter sp.]|uniref:TetR family transcriptional regulator n=2 Tax=Accumulibacter sp. TaxID=2053492 RepID=UPI001B1F5575|nr:TetR family transcriptional regulator [Accumulibacter sp.]MBO3702034.1 TetR family transcriptional regulator [Accumulibacter sp.]